MALKENFDKAAENIKNLAITPSDDDLLEIYGLYKQATVGDVNTTKPGMFDFKGKAKWEAWNGRKGTTPEAAMDAYVHKVTSLISTFGLKS